MWEMEHLTVGADPASCFDCTSVLAYGAGPDAVQTSLYRSSTSCPTSLPPSLPARLLYYHSTVWTSPSPTTKPPSIRAGSHPIPFHTVHHPKPTVAETPRARTWICQSRPTDDAKAEVTDFVQHGRANRVRRWRLRPSGEAGCSTPSSFLP